MTPDRLAAHFTRIAEAPEAIPHLRQFILDLAIRGKLVEQSPSDEPAIELLQRIQREREQLVKDGKISRVKPPIPARADDLAFDLMPGWHAAKVGQILLELQTGPFGSTLHQSDYQRGGIPVINPASIRNERLVPIDSMAVGKETLERLASFKLRPGDIVMGRRGEMGRCAVVTVHEDGWLCGTGSLILRLPKCVYPRFFVTLVGSPFVRAYLGGAAVGSTMQNLNQSILLNLVVGLPPLAEQHRIVSKVDELMALCDRLEAAQAERESRRDRLAATSLQRLSQPADAPAFREHARFHLSHLQRLTTRPEQIKQLRQAILAVASLGKLTASWRNDNPDTPHASHELRNIDDLENSNTPKRAGRLWGAGHVPDLTDDERNSLPPTWVWAKVREIGGHPDDVVQVGPMSMKSNEFVGSGIPVLNVGCVQWDHFDESKLNFLSVENAKRFDRYRIAEGDIVFTRSGTIGRCAIATKMQAGYLMTFHLLRARPNRRKILSEYLHIVFRGAPHVRRQMEESAVGATRAGFNTNLLANLDVPLPPLAEQHRIVAKVDELMALCDRLEAQLTTTQTQSRRLLEAVLHEALAGA